MPTAATTAANCNPQHVCGDATNAIIDINSFQSAGYGYFFPSIELLAVVAPKVLQQPWQQR